MLDVIVFFGTISVLGTVIFGVTFPELRPQAHVVMLILAGVALLSTILLGVVDYVRGVNHE